MSHKMDQETRIQDLRTIALEVATVHSRHQEAWADARAAAVRLASLIYQIAGLEPPSPPSTWAWAARSIELRLNEACHDARRRLINERERDTEEVEHALIAVSQILAVIARHRPGASKKEWMEEIVQTWEENAPKKGPSFDFSQPLSHLAAQCRSLEEFEKLHKEAALYIGTSELDDRFYSELKMSHPDGLISDEALKQLAAMSEDIHSTDEQIEQRLSAMREHYEMTDAQVVEQAMDQTLPSDPDFCEWLVLLGMGHLIPKGESNSAPEKKEDYSAIRRGAKLGMFLISHSTADFRWCSRGAFLRALEKDEPEAIAFYNEWVEEGCPSR